MLREHEWEILIDRIKRKQCTPFLGAGVCKGVLPLGSEIAEKWTERFGYPFPDSTNLIRVAQYVAVMRDRMTPKSLILDDFKKAKPPNFDNPNEPHRTLADLRLPIYLTTNYDSFMSDALRHCGWDVEREFYRWNRFLTEFLDRPSIFERDKAYVPTPARPLVFHLHGNEQALESMVLIEDDYIDFLINTSSEEFALPLTLSRALSANSLLFIGYSIADWNFRVLLGSINRNNARGAQRLNVAVMPKPSSAEDEQLMIEEYLTKYYQAIDVRVHWATAEEFCRDLRARLELK